jgi:hypothetical protein
MEYWLEDFVVVVCSRSTRISCNAASDIENYMHATSKPDVEDHDSSLVACVMLHALTLPLMTTLLTS